MGSRLTRCRVAVRLCFALCVMKLTALTPKDMVVRGKHPGLCHSLRVLVCKRQSPWS